MVRAAAARLVAVLLLLVVAVLPVQAQDVAAEGAPAAVPEDLRGVDVDALMARLSDEQVRSLLLAELRREAARDTAAANDVNVFRFIADMGLAVVGSTVDAVVRLPDLATNQAGAFVTFYRARDASGTAAFVGLTLLAAVVGLAAAWAVTRAAVRWRERIATATGGEGLAATLRTLGTRFLLDAAGVIAFMIVGRLILDLVMAPADAPIAKMLLFAFVVLPMAMACVARFMIAPGRPELRLVYTDDWTARYLYRHQILLVALVGLQVFIVDFNARNGVEVGQLRLGFWLTAAILIYLAVIAWRARAGLRLMLRGRDEHLTPAEEWAANAYPAAVIVLCFLIWLLVEILVAQRAFHLLVDGQHYVTLALLLMAPAIDTTIRGLVRHLVPPMKGEGLLAEEAYESTKRAYVRIGRVIVFVLVILLLARIWEIDFTNLASAGIGARAAAGLIEILFVLGAGFLVYQVVTLWLNRKLADEQTALGVDPHAESGGEGGGAGGSRLSTVLPLFRGTLQAAIVVITILLALGNVGIDITPLLAGAGIIGLAIGFGAQKLVADVVSGIFFLIDDAFRTGEYIDVGEAKGTVENISLRSIRLRHHRGPLNTIPFGEIKKVQNLSRDWVIMKLEFRVPYDTDVARVKKIIKRIGAELMEDPEMGPNFLEPLKSQGVYAMEDSAMVIKVKFMAKPGEQFIIRREAYQRIRAAFEAEGIPFAHRQVTVHVPKDADPAEAAAAAAAAEQQQAPQPA